MKAADLAKVLKGIRAIGLGAAIAASGSFPALARPEDDAFSATKLNACLWDDWSYSSASVTPGSTLALETSATTAPSFAQIFSQYTVSGDFSYETTLALSGAWSQSIASTDQEYGYVGFYNDDANNGLIAVNKNQSDTQIVVYTRVAGTFNVAARIDIQGAGAQLRIARSGSSLSFQYNTGSGWLTAATLANFSSDGLVWLGATTLGTARKLVASFRDFRISSGTTSYRPYISTSVAKRPDFRLGGVMSDYLIQRVWGPEWARTDPIKTLADNGVRWIRTGVTTVRAPALANTQVTSWRTLPYSTDFWSSREYAAQVLTEGATQGMHLNVFLFLSDTAAGAGTQNAPAAWRGLSVAETATKLEDYAYETAQYFKSRGLNVEIYEVGNEIDNGILNFTPDDRISRPAGVSTVNNMTYMREQVWPTEATLLKAAIRGLRRAEPRAKILLHSAGVGISPGDMLAKSFFRAMKDNGVDYDMAGISLPYASYYWRLNTWGANCWFQRLQDTVDTIGALGKPTLVSEGNYFATSTGAVSPPMPEYPFTEAGQAAWTRETLRFASNNSNVAGFTWFYPDWNDHYLTSSPSNTADAAGGLFKADSTPRAAMAELAAFAAAAMPAVRTSALFSTAQSASQSFLRFHNTGTGSGTVTLTLQNATNGASIGQWTSPTLAPGAEQQFTIGTIEAALGSVSLPPFYSASLQSSIAGHFQHILWGPGGTLTNVSTCATGVLSNPTELSGVHSSLFQANYPSSVVVSNTAGAAQTVTIGVYDARDGTKLGSYTSPSVSPNGQLVLTVAQIEAGIRLTPTGAMLHYVLRVEGTFVGYLQHLLNNVQKSVVTDMTAVCSLSGGAGSVASTPLVAGTIFSTAQTAAQSFLRLHNTGTSAGSVTITLKDYVTGQDKGRWTSPSIPPGAEKQYAIETLESEANITGTKPAYYAISAASTFNGYLQHVLWRPADGTLTNLSTCASGVTADPANISGVHSSRLDGGFPSSIVINNTGDVAASVTLGIYDASNGARLGGYVSTSIAPGGNRVVRVSDMEAQANFQPTATMFHYVIKTESAFTGFLQNLVNNIAASAITDMTTTCSLVASGT